MILVVGLVYFSSASFIQCLIITFLLFTLFCLRFHCVLLVDLINFCPFHIIHSLRCVKTGNKKSATCVATLLQNKLNSDFGVLPLMFKPVNKLSCCETGLMWEAKRATSPFNLFYSNVARQIARFLLPVFTHLHTPL